MELDGLWGSWLEQKGRNTGSACKRRVYNQSLRTSNASSATLISWTKTLDYSKVRRHDKTILSDGGFAGEATQILTGLGEKTCFFCIFLYFSSKKHVFFQTHPWILSPLLRARQDLSKASVKRRIYRHHSRIEAGWNFGECFHGGFGMDFWNKTFVGRCVFSCTTVTLWSDRCLSR